MTVNLAHGIERRRRVARGVDDPVGDRWVRQVAVLSAPLVDVVGDVVTDDDAAFVLLAAARRAAAESKPAEGDDIAVRADGRGRENAVRAASRPERIGD